MLANILKGFPFVVYSKHCKLFRTFPILLRLVLQLIQMFWVVLESVLTNLYILPTCTSTRPMGFANFPAHGLLCTTKWVLKLSSYCSGVSSIASGITTAQHFALHTWNWYIRFTIFECYVFPFFPNAWFFYKYKFFTSHLLQNPYSFFSILYCITHVQLRLTIFALFNKLACNQ